MGTRNKVNRIKRTRGEEMSEIQYEECSLEEATHIEIGGVIYHIKDSEYNATVVKFMDFISDKSPMIRVTGVALYEFIYISEISFPIFGIKPLKEKKQEPREFVHIFRKGSSMSYPSWAENGMFRCVEISEEIE